MCSNDSLKPSGERDVIDFVSRVTDAARLRIEENLPHGFVRLKVAEAERRQAQHDIRSVEDIVTELVRNSRDAGATRVLVAFQKEQGRYRKLTVIDNGRGIPGDMHELVFEPRVTSKSEDFEEDRYGVHGRGMALFSIRSRTTSASIVSSETGVGTVINVNVDTKRVPERSDQATLPRIEHTELGDEVGSGPHNVARVLLEMSVDCPQIEFYIGSFSEILATARFIGLEEGYIEAPWGRLAEVDDARELADIARRILGLPVSERNAYRVINDEIAIVETILKQASLATGVVKTHGIRNAGSLVQRGVRTRSPIRKISRDDLAEMGVGCGEIVGDILGRYYLKSAGTPRVRRGRGKIIISFFVTGEEGEGE